MKSIKARILMTALAGGIVVGGLSYLPSVYAADAPFKIAAGNYLMQTTSSNNPKSKMNLTGTVDWVKGKIRVTGSGAPPTNPNMPAGQKRLMALRAAQLDAYRLLGEMIDGVKVDSETIVKDFVTESDIIKTEVHSFIKGAKKVKEAYLSDGTVQIELELEMYGPQSLFSKLDDKIYDDNQINTVPYTQPTNAITPPPSPPPIQPTVEPIQTPVPPTPPPTPANPGGIYTGVIIDARNKGIEPCMSPAILDSSGKELYVGNMPIDADFVVNIGIVGYATTIQDAKKNTKRVGTNPLVLNHGVTAAGKLKTDIKLGSGDAQALAQLDQESNVLSRASIIILL